MAIAFAIVMDLISLVYVAWRWRAGGLSEMSSWYIVASLIFVNFGFLAYTLEAGPDGSPGISVGLTVVSLGLLSFAIGAFSRGAIAGSLPRQVMKFRLAVFDPVVERRKLILLAAAILLPAWSYFFLLGYVPLFDGVGAVASSGLDGIGQLQASRLSRDSYASANGTRVPFQGILQIARNVGVPILAAYAIAQLDTGSSKPLRITILGLSVVTILLAGQRWPLIYVIVACIIALAMSEKGIRPTRLMQASGILFLIGVAVSVLQGRTLEQFSGWGEATWFGVTNLFGRIFYEQSIVPIWSYERASFGHAELLGRSYIDSLAAWLPGPGKSFPVEFYMRTTGDSHAYTAPPDFYTEAFINFGFVGVVLMSFAWGMLLRSIDFRKLSSDNVFNIGLKGGLASVFVLSAFTGAIFTLSGVLMVGFSAVVVSLVKPSRAWVSRI